MNSGALPLWMIFRVNFESNIRFEAKVVQILTQSSDSAAITKVRVASVNILVAPPRNVNSCFRPLTELTLCADIKPRFEAWDNQFCCHFELLDILRPFCMGQHVTAKHMMTNKRRHFICSITSRKLTLLCCNGYKLTVAINDYHPSAMVGIAVSAVGVLPKQLMYRSF